MAFRLCLVILVHVSICVTYTQQTPVLCPLALCEKPACENPIDGPCCPYCPSDCIINGVNYTSGDSFPSKDGCKKCKCNDGKYKCSKRNIYCRKCRYKGVKYAHLDSVPSKDVCKKCHCDNKKVRCSKICHKCKYNGAKYKSGVSFPSKDGCNDCRCDDGKVSCTEKFCPDECKWGNNSRTCAGIASLTCTIGTYCVLQQDPKIVADAGGICCYEKGCVDGYNIYQVGDLINDDVCRPCKCMEDGTIQCLAIYCTRPCPNPEDVDGECCPKCSGCTDENGNTYHVGDPTNNQTCEPCFCTESGSIQCLAIDCFWPCANPEYIEGQCCPVNCSGCTDENGNTYHVGDPTNNDTCQPCICMESGRIQCLGILCAPCPNPEYIEGQCCPVNCSGCQIDGQDYEVGDITRGDQCNGCECVEDGSEICHATSCVDPGCENAEILKGQCCPTCPEGCHINGQDYIVGQLTSEDECGGCECNADGGETCFKMACEDPECEGADLEVLEGQCCPSCQEVPPTMAPIEGTGHF